MEFFRRHLWGSGDSKERDKEKDVSADSSAEADGADEVQAPQSAPAEGSVGQLLWGLLSSKMGSDVFSSGISLPAWMYEPLTILQRSAEVIEHHHLLAAANAERDAATRLAYVAAFAISAYGATNDARGKTNFNPILGETFAFIDERSGARFFAEQVSHHPPVSAFHCVAGDGGWQFWQNSSPVTKFLGNSLDINTQGRSHVYLAAHKEHIYFSNPNTRVHNIVLGKLWFEHYGELVLTNATTGHVCTVSFKKAGLFQGTQHKVEGVVVDKEHHKQLRLDGEWNAAISLEWLKGERQGQRVEVFRCAPDVWVEPYAMTKFARTFNERATTKHGALLSTDSRRRPDRAYLQRGDAEKATEWKQRLEGAQRLDRKAREAGDKPAWNPQYFTRLTPSEDDAHAKYFKEKGEKGSKSQSRARRDSEPHKLPVALTGHDARWAGLWVYKGDYWEQSESWIRKNGAAKVDAADPDAACDDVLCPPHLRGLACDFARFGAQEQSGERGGVPRTASSRTLTTESKSKESPMGTSSTSEASAKDATEGDQ